MEDPRRALRLALVLLATGVVGACGAGVKGDDPRIIVHDFEGGMDAEITGTVTYDADRNCLFLRHDDPVEPEEEFTTPLWPSGTRPVVHDGKRGVRVPGRGRFVEGDAMSVGGGMVTRRSVEYLDIPPECIAEGGIVVINF
jgi:hypothetical protein